MPTVRYDPIAYETGQGWYCRGCWLLQPSWLAGAIHWIWVHQRLVEEREQLRFLRTLQGR